MSRKLIFELAWILPSVAIPVGVLVAVVITAFGMHIRVPGDSGNVEAAAVNTTAPFNQPGLVETGPGQYQLTMIAQIWSFQPNEIRVPAGSEVTFVVTSRDVIHGLHVEGTNVNVMVVPGRITEQRAVFKKPGEYRFVCHEYCGGGHHAMFGKVIVEGQP